MSDADELSLISAKKLAEVLHAHAHALLLARPTLTPEAALAKAAELAVMIYDDLMLEAVLRKAAADCNVSDTLARLVAMPGGATLALT